MSRQPVRQRPPSDDDLQPATEDELHKVARAAEATQPPQRFPKPVESPPGKAAAMPADRGAYFTGHYAAPAIDRRLADAGVPDSLRECVAGLIAILHERGLGIALAALRADAKIDKRHVESIARLLTAIDWDDRRDRA